MVIGQRITVWADEKARAQPPLSQVRRLQTKKAQRPGVSSRVDVAFDFDGEHRGLTACDQGRQAGDCDPRQRGTLCPQRLFCPQRGEHKEQRHRTELQHVTHFNSPSL